MLKTLFDAFTRLSDERPAYTGSRCLVERHAVGGCDRCMQACPHDAVRITDRVDILEDACTGCGLCVQACPSGALEHDLVPALAALKAQGVNAEEPTPAVLKCSRVPGDGATVACLGRVSPALVSTSRAWNQALTLVHGDCAACRLGGPSVPDSVRDVLDIAAAYREATPNAAPAARLVQYGGGGHDEAAASAAPPAVPDAPPPTVTRRAAFSALFTQARGTAARLIPDQPLPGISTRPEPGPIPDEWVWRRRSLRPKPDAAAEQYWPTPSVNEKCIFCPVCENVCPTDAVTRERHEDGTFTLKLDVAACTGCDACVQSCPPQAMTLEARRAFADLASTVVLREGEPF